MKSSKYNDNLKNQSGHSSSHYSRLGRQEYESLMAEVTGGSTWRQIVLCQGKNEGESKNGLTNQRHRKRD
jgi:hypothetical protein